MRAAAAAAAVAAAMAAEVTEAKAAAASEAHLRMPSTSVDAMLKPLRARGAVPAGWKFTEPFLASFPLAALK